MPEVLLPSLIPWTDPFEAFSASFQALVPKKAGEYVSTSNIISEEEPQRTKS